MSDKKRTKQQLDSKANKQKRKKRSNMAGYIGIAVALCFVGILGVVIWAVNLSPNYITYTVNDHQIDKDFYTCVYRYDTMTSKDWKKYEFDPFKNPYHQKFNYTQANESFATWGDYFQSLTDDSLDFLYIMTDTAKKTGYTYSDSVKSSIKSEYSSVKQEAEKQEMEFEEYMLATYGSEISPDTLLKYLTLYYKANDFYKALTTDKALFVKTFALDDNFFENYYKQNKEKIDVVTYRYYYLENTKENAEKIEKFKNAKSSYEFKKLCDLYSASLNYAENDLSLQENQSVQMINSLTNSKIAKDITSYSAKENKTYYQTAEVDGKESVEFVFLVKARTKDTEPYNKSEVKNWEFSVMSLFLEEYKDKNFKCSEAEKGIKQFKKDINKGYAE